jgi:hypothetical protein
MTNNYTAIGAAAFVGLAMALLGSFNKQTSEHHQTRKRPTDAPADFSPVTDNLVDSCERTGTRKSGPAA